MARNFEKWLARVFGPVLIAGLVLGACGSTNATVSEKGVITGYVRIFEGLRKVPEIGIPVPGRVTFESTRGVSRTIITRRTGEFSVDVKPGKYLVFGGPASWNNKCLAHLGKPITVSAGDTVVVTVACVGY